MIIQILPQMILPWINSKLAWFCQNKRLLTKTGKLLALACIQTTKSPNIQTIKPPNSQSTDPPNFQISNDKSETINCIHNLSYLLWMIGCIDIIKLCIFSMFGCIKNISNSMFWLYRNFRN